MPHDLASLRGSPNSLARHYRRFRVGERLLLTGHSHQAWPDAAWEGQQRAFDDAAEHVDDKWGHAFAQADRVRRGWARLLDDVDGHIALAASTHQLVVRLLSALPLPSRRRLVSTDSEFHTLRRQLDRLAEEGIEVVRVAQRPLATFMDRFIAAIGEAPARTAAVLVSSVFFNSGRLVPGLREINAACRRHGLPLVIDAYHHLNVVPFSVRQDDLSDAFILGGGYKYCQLGEGNCCLRFPRDTTLRPVITGWFSEFTALTDKTHPHLVPYGQGPERFAGATYDPTSHYRAAAVFDFFEREALTVGLLREVSQHQVGVIAAEFDRLDLDPGVIRRDREAPLSDVAGFLALHSPIAGELHQRLHAHGVMTDYRGEVLRLGPAPYLSDQQLGAALALLGKVAQA